MIRSRVVVGAVVLSALAGCTGGVAVETSPATAPAVTPGTTSTSLTPDPTTSASAAPVAIPPYDSDAFKFWSDLNGDRCNTRDAVLARDAVEFHDTDGDGCAERYEFVAILDPYTERVISPRGEIDIDHVVSRKNAWTSGAWAWTDDEREVFANDEANLLAVEDDVNRAKSDRGPDRWHPPARSGWCLYATIYRDVKAAYGLEVTPEELAGLDELLGAC